MKRLPWFRKVFYLILPHLTSILENEIIKGRLDLDDPASLDQKQIPEPPQTNKESTKKVKKVKKKKKKAKESDKSSSDDSDGDNMADL